MIELLWPVPALAAMAWWCSCLQRKLNDMGEAAEAPASQLRQLEEKQEAPRPNPSPRPFTVGQQPPRLVTPGRARRDLEKRLAEKAKAAALLARTARQQGEA